MKEKSNTSNKGDKDGGNFKEASFRCSECDVVLQESINNHHDNSSPESCSSSSVRSSLNEPGFWRCFECTAYSFCLLLLKEHQQTVAHSTPLLDICGECYKTQSKAHNHGSDATYLAHQRKRTSIHDVIGTPLDTHPSLISSYHLNPLGFNGSLRHLITLLSQDEHLGSTLKNVFETYGDRPCIGDIVYDDDLKPSRLKWNTYRAV